MLGGYRRNHDMEKLLEAIRVPCPNAVYGCRAKLAYYDHLDHLRGPHHRRHRPPGCMKGVAEQGRQCTTVRARPRSYRGVPPRSGAPGILGAGPAEFPEAEDRRVLVYGRSCTTAPTRRARPGEMAHPGNRLYGRSSATSTPATTPTSRADRAELVQAGNHRVHGRPSSTDPPITGVMQRMQNCFYGLGLWN